MDSILEIAKKYGTDKSGGHALTYDIYLNHLRDKKLNILELGIDKGNSLMMWHDAFPNASIHGWDRDIKKDYDGNPLPSFPKRIQLYEFDQSNRESIEELARKINPTNCPLFQYDIIIDDCSHVDADQQRSLGILFPYLKSGGYYFIEDIGVSPGTIAIINDFIDTGIFCSEYITLDEDNYLMDNISECTYANGNNILLRKK